MFNKELDEFKKLLTEIRDELKKLNDKMESKEEKDYAVGATCSDN